MKLNIKLKLKRIELVYMGFGKSEFGFESVYSVT